MAITVVGSGSVSTATTGTVFPPWPSGHDVNDIGLAFVETSGDVQATLQLARGFSYLGSTVSGFTGALTRMDIFWARATSNAMTSPVFNGQADHQWAILFAFRGCSTTDTPGAVIATSGGVNTATATTLTTPTITTLVPNCFVMTGFGYSADSASSIISGWSNNGGFTTTSSNNFGTTAGDGGGGGFAWFTVPTPGATGTSQATSAIATAYAPFTLALRPAAVPNTTSGNFLPFFS